MSRREIHIREWIHDKMQNQIYLALAMGMVSVLLVLVISLTAGSGKLPAEESMIEEKDIIGFLEWSTPSDAMPQGVLVLEMTDSEGTEDGTESGDTETPQTGTENGKAAQSGVPQMQKAPASRSYGRFVLKTGASDIIWGYLKMNGWTDTAIAGVLGNFHQESGLDPGRVERNGIGYGLGQWSYGRRTGLETYASRRNLPASDLLVQLDYLMVEPGESSFVQSYMKTEFSSVEAAARTWNDKWERPDRRKAHLEDVRIPYANAYYYYYTGQAGANTYYRILSGESSRSGTDDGRHTGLVSDKKGWRYRYSNGKYASGVWKVINGKRFYFGLDGYLVPEQAEALSATASEAFQEVLPGSKTAE